jgi:hexosaminidase
VTSGAVMVIPRPARASVSAGGKRVELRESGFVIAADDASRPVANLLRAALQASTGWEIAVVPAASGARPNAVTLTVAAASPAGPVGPGLPASPPQAGGASVPPPAGALPAPGGSLPDGALPDGAMSDGAMPDGALPEDIMPGEGYRLRACPEEGVVIEGGGPAGVFYGAQTLRQLLPPQTLRLAPAGGRPEVLELPAAEIEDFPRYSWRGVHLDVARHFFPKSWILKLIDLAALHKLNVLHLHLTDDQGWRIPIERYPLLTEIGSWRKESPVGLAREKRFDGTPYGGCYTRQDLEEIVAYAAQRYMTVVPEIDMPGHMQAAIAAYPELGNTDAYDNSKIRRASRTGGSGEGHRKKGSRHRKGPGVRTRWGISRHVLNVDDATIEFCGNVLEEVMDIFPGPYVHLGGDECPAAEWHDSERARRRMRELGYRAEAQLQGWFMAQVARRLEARGRRMVGWDEVVDAGGPREAVIMAWRRDGYMGRWAAELGHKVVMAPEYYLYLDWAHSDDAGEPLAIRGATSVRDVYTFDPVPRGLSADARANIIGAQAQLWTEYVPDPGKAEYMYFPRLCAFAEVVWSPPGGDYAEFEDRLAGHLPRLDACDVRYRRPAGPGPGPRPVTAPAADGRARASACRSRDDRYGDRRDLSHSGSG